MTQADIAVRQPRRATVRVVALTLSAVSLAVAPACGGEGNDRPERPSLSDNPELLERVEAFLKRDMGAEYKRRYNSSVPEPGVMNYFTVGSVSCEATGASAFRCSASGGALDLVTATCAEGEYVVEGQVISASGKSTWDDVEPPRQIGSPEPCPQG